MQRKDEILAKKAKLAELRRQREEREQRQKESGKRESFIGDPSEVPCSTIIGAKELGLRSLGQSFNACSHNGPERARKLH